MRSLHYTSTHNQQWESNPRHSDLEAKALSTESHVHIKSRAVGQLYSHYILPGAITSFKVSPFPSVE